MKKEIEISTAFHGICNMIVCCTPNLTPDEVLEFCNRENPAGTTNGWSTVYWVDAEEKRRPVQCAEKPERIHVLVGC